jgi:CPA2 family monovalent cation:H+ antiporter-2
MTTGMLIAQDVVVVLVLVLIPLLPGADTGGHSTSFVVGVGEAVGKLVALIVAIILVERVAMRRLFQHLAAARELLAVSSITVSLGAIGACWALDLSPVLGGFVAGIVMADAPYASQVRSEIAPIRMGLVAVFFAYVGMLADAAWMYDHALLIVAVVVPLLVGKAVVTWVAARVAHVPAAASILTAAALCQLGEFSFAVLTAGDSAGLVGDETFRLLVSVSLVTLLVTPWVLAGTSRVVQQRALAAGASVDLQDEPVEHAVGGHAIIVGVGPAGRAVAAAFAGAGVPIVVVELNPRADTGDEDDDLPVGTRVVFGDAGRPEILAGAGVATARIVVVTIPDPVAIRTVISQSRQLAANVPIVARGRYHRYVPDLAAAGADDVVDEEQVTGRELAEVALRRLVLEGAVERRERDRRAHRDDLDEASR